MTLTEGEREGASEIAREEEEQTDRLRQCKRDQGEHKRPYVLKNKTYKASSPTMTNGSQMHSHKP